MNMNRLVPRLIYYFKTGYIQYVSYPVGFLSFASNVFYLAISSIPSLKTVFPSFYLFLVFSLISIPAASIGFGYFHYKRSFMFQAEQDIQVESSSYSRDIILPSGLPGAKILCRLARQHGLDVSEYESQIKKSEELSKRGRSANG